MPDELNYSAEQAEPGSPGAFRVPPRTWIIWLVLFAGIIVLMLFRDHVDSQSEPLSEYSFLHKVDSNLIAQAEIRFNPQATLTEISGKYYRTDNEGKKMVDGSTVPFHTKARLTEAMEEKLLSLPQFEPSEPNRMLSSVLWSAFPIIVMALIIWFFFIRRIRTVTTTVLATPEIKAYLTKREDRMDKILEKWEEQARRMDAILDRMDREK